MNVFYKNIMSCIKSIRLTATDWKNHIATRWMFISLISLLTSCATVTDTFKEATRVQIPESFVQLASLCPKTVWINGEKREYEAESNGQLIVKFSEGFDSEKTIENIQNKFDVDILQYREEQKYALIQLPVNNLGRSFRGYSKELLEDGAIAWVDIHCQPKVASDSAAKRCVPFSKHDPSIASPLGMPLPHRTPPDVSQFDRVKLRKLNFLGYFDVDQSIQKEDPVPPIVFVMDAGFNPANQYLEHALAELNLRPRGNTNAIPTATWNYCTEKPNVDNKNHGTIMSKLIAGDCDHQGCVPGISQRARVFLAQIFDETGIEFISPMAIAGAISDAETLGADIINMSLSFGNGHQLKDDNGNEIKILGLQIISDAIKNSPNVLFVVGSDDDNAGMGNEEFPAGYKHNNLLVIQPVSMCEWNDYIKTEWTNWRKQLHLGSLSLPEGGGMGGVSNSIAIASGAAALVLSKPQYSNLDPMGVIGLLADNVSCKNWTKSSHADTNKSHGYLNLSFLHKLPPPPENCPTPIPSERICD